MSDLLVVAEHRRGELTAATPEAIGAALSIKQPDDCLAVAVMAANPDSHAAALSLEGVDEIIRIAAPADEFDPDAREAALGALLESRPFAVVVAPHSIDSWGCMPAVAAAGQHGYASDVLALRIEDGQLVATRAAYGEKLRMEVDFPGRETVVLTVRANVFAPPTGAGQPQVSDFAAPAAETRSPFVAYHEAEAAEDVDITQSQWILSIGRGIGQEEEVERFAELADAMGFTLTCSRPIADNGWLPKARQVGQSGKTVANCQIYLALGISGSSQHLMGMKHVPNIIAVNTDADASIFGVARYGAVADLFEIADELDQHFK